jgi:hypothetical protein
VRAPARQPAAAQHDFPVWFPRRSARLPPGTQWPACAVPTAACQQGRLQWRSMARKRGDRLALVGMAAATRLTPSANQIAAGATTHHPSIV